MVIDCDKAEATIQKLIATIDEMVALQLSAIIQYPAFKRIEALWAGLYRLLDTEQNLPLVRIRILDLSWNELSDDLNLSVRLQSSLLFRLVYQKELNTLGGEPFGLLLVDHPVSIELDEVSGHDDLYTLQLLAELGQESLCPVILPLAVDFIGSADPDIWCDTERVTRILDSDDYGGWRHLRRLPVSRFLGLTLPEVLIRPPWKHCYWRIKFDEVAVYNEDSGWLWGNSAFEFAANVINEFHRIRWFGYLRVAESGGALIRNRNSEKQRPMAARLRLTDSLETFYSGQGFIPMTTCYLSNQLAFFNNQSVFQTTENEEDSLVFSMLQTTLIGCRFGHYLKMLIREHIGSYDSAETCERRLNDWLQGYTSNVDYADERVLARYPLKRSRARVWGNKKLGTFFCEVELQPQYQFDYINSGILLRTDVSELSEAVSRGSALK